MQEADLTFRNLISFLRRQIKLILFVVLALTTVSAVILFSLTPLFSASALVLVEAGPKNLLDPSFESVRGQIDDARISSEVEIVQSAPILLDVISKAGLINDPEFGVRLGLRDRILSYLQLSKPTIPTGEAALQRVLDDLKKAISAERRPRTNLLTLSVKSQDAAKAARISNIWAQSYIQSQVTAKINGALLSRDALQARLETARLGVVNSEGSLDLFLDQNITKIAQESGRNDISDIRSKLSDLESENSSSSELANAIEKSLANNNWTSVVSSLQNQALSELERQRQGLIEQVSQSAESGATDLKARLIEIEQRMRDTAQGELKSLRSSITAGSSKVDNLRQELRSAVLSSPLDPDILARVYELQQTSTLARSQYQTLLSRIQDLDIQATIQLADSRIVAEAMTPQNASFPNVPTLLLMSIFGSSVFAFILAFLKENIIGGFLTAEQTAAVLRIPVAATLPYLRRDTKSTPADLTIKAILSPYAESIRRIRAALEHSSSRQPGAISGALVIMITSANPKEGKSTVALAVARSMAVAKRKVLLIDCDLRRPSLHANVGLPPGDLLRQVLAGDVEFDDMAALVSRDPLSSVALILASAVRDTPTDQLVGGPIFPRLLDWARARFDTVILDTPPIGSVVDGLYIAPLADGLLYVIRSGATRQVEAKAGLAAVATVMRGDAVVMAVLNQQNHVDASYGKQYTAYGY